MRHPVGVGGAAGRTAWGARVVAMALLAAVTLGAWTPPGDVARGQPATHPLQIVLFIGDGMGHQHLELLRAFRHSKPFVDELEPAASLATRSLSGVTDSAAAATALSTGHPTANGMVAMGPHGERWPTLLERAKQAGMRVGLVSTTTVTDATPAAFAAHVERRQEHQSVARQYLDLGVDVILGGGRYQWTHRTQDGGGQAPLERARSLGYLVVQTGSELRTVAQKAAERGQAAGEQARLLGLFADGPMAYEAERPPHQPSLAEMTETALRWLDGGSGQPFVLVVEAGRIDHLGHEGRVDILPQEMQALDEAVGVALRFAAKRPGALVVLTADHETGGLERSAARIWYFRWPGGHTSREVPLRVKGAGAERFQGLRHLTDVGGVLSRLVEEQAALTVHQSTGGCGVWSGLS
ncbi:MAG: alkaline phosphatase [Limnochordaceae bacterium]|nr:alkaline phosphatase [Limnochordaceae bacterium]